MILNTAWNDLLRKKANAIDDCDLGEVQEVQAEFIVTENGIINKKGYYIPKNLIASFDGRTIYFRIMKVESKQYRQDDIKFQKILKKII
jgi:transcriptional regulator of NAD metabolism